MRRIKRLFCDRDYRFYVKNRLGWYRHWSDRDFLSLQYRIRFGKEIHWDSPVTFNEKMQWLKVNFRRPEHSLMVDKVEAKRLVSEKIGEQYTVPTLGVWSNFDEIDFDSLPEQFVLKCTHDSGGLVICRDKAMLDRKKAARKIEKSLARNYYYASREWPYRDVPPRILAEPYLRDGEHKTLPVYKIFCFGGEPKLIQSIQNDKTKEESIDYFDPEWKLLPLRQNYPNSKSPVEKPQKLEKMLGLARCLSEGFPFLRTDFYLVNGEIFFSEFTFFSDSGLAKFVPEHWDRELGDLILLPEKEL